MSTIKQILNQASQSREPKSPQIYRRGRVTNSAAYYRGPRTDPEAGVAEKRTAEFLNAIAKPFGAMIGERQKEWSEAERNAGIASFTRATPEQRAKMRNAIKNGIISESESPYFREGVSIAYTKSLLGKYNQELFQKYEDWPDKDIEDSGNFDKFLDEFDAEYAPYFETVHQDILTEHFIPGQMGVRRQLQQRHTERLNKNYRDKAYATKQGELYQILQSYDEDLVKEMLKDTDMPMSQLINRGRDNNDVTMGQLDLIKSIMVSNKAITKEQKEQLSQFPIGRKLMEDLNKLKGEKISKSYDDPPKKVFGHEIHEVKKGDTLFDLAKKYKTDVKTLMRINGLEEKDIKDLEIGRNLLLKPLNNG